MTFPLTTLPRPTVPPALTVTTTAPHFSRPVTALPRPGSREFRDTLAEKRRALAALTDEVEALGYEVRRMERAEERMLAVRERGEEVAA